MSNGGLPTSRLEWARSFNLTPAADIVRKVCTMMIETRQLVQLQYLVGRLFQELTFIRC